MILSHAGKAHRALTRLSEGPATLSELRTDCVSNNQARKLAFIMAAMTKARLVTHTPGFGYAITWEGQDALAGLDSGRDVFIGEPVPNVRVFGAAA